MRRLAPLTFCLLATASAQSFTDASERLGEYPTGFAAFGGGVVDVDGDGRMDLFRNGALLYQRDGGFESVLLSDTNEPWAAYAADYDNDGRVELALGGYLRAPSAMAVFEVDVSGGIVERFDTGSVNPVYFDQGALWIDADQDGLLDLFVSDDGLDDKLFRNLGDGQFEDASGQVPTIPLTTYGAAAADYDRDGDQDIYLTVCSGSPETRINLLYRNDGGTFTEVAAAAGLADDLDGWGVLWADYDNDGWLDVYFANTGLGEDGLSNRLYRNLGDGTFADVTASAGVGGGSASFGANAADFDNDGWMDLMPGDVSRAVVLRNRGDGTFEEVEVSGAGTATSAAGDVDGDGFADLFLPGGGAAGADVLLLNDGNENRHLTVSLRGVESNRSGIGARVEVEAGPLSMVREIQSGSGMMSHNHGLTAHFGLGDAASARVTVRWPSGEVDVLEDVAADQRIHVVEGEGLNAPPAFFRHLAPADGAAVTGGETSLAWEPAEDPERALAGYTVLLVAPDGAQQEVEVDPGVTSLDVQLAGPGTYRWRVLADDGRSLRASAAAWSFTNGSLESEPTAAAGALGLDVYPNPAAAGFTASYVLSGTAEVELGVVDVLGRTVAARVVGGSGALAREVRFDEVLPAGLYVVRIRAGDRVATRRLVVAR